MAVSLDKLEAQAPGLVSLAKTASVSLQKRDLTGHTAKMALALDFSGSMRKLYQDGTVQRLAERVLALATRLDDDGAIDVFLFHSSAEYAGELTLDNYQNGVDRLVDGRRMGTTNYAAVMRLIREHYKSSSVRRGLFRKETQAAEFPAYVMFITDGNPDSKTEATRQLVDASREGIFWQFMGVGREKFEYLHRLDSEAPGRLIDNANFLRRTTPVRAERRAAVRPDARRVPRVAAAGAAGGAHTRTSAPRSRSGGDGTVLRCGRGARPVGGPARQIDRPSQPSRGAAPWRARGIVPGEIAHARGDDGPQAPWNGPNRGPAGRPQA